MVSDIKGDNRSKQGYFASAFAAREITPDNTYVVLDKTRNLKWRMV